MAATGCSFQARSGQQAARVDGAPGGEPPIATSDGGVDARTIDAPSDAKVFLDAPPVSGSLTVSSAAVASGDTNLTTEGTADWAHWGHASATDFDHKSGANMISDVTVTNGASRLQVTSISTTASWTDGTPHATVSTTGTGVGATEGAGLSFTVPAGTTPQTLRVYVGDKSSSERIDVSLSDGSAPAYTANATAGAGAVHTVYTITYNAASPGQTLTVTWTDVADNGGFEMLMSATLQ
jgi:hypothetical protein